ncbi:hypothetical protein BSKO_13503 [Bryopsis sp. KO-2023]|nr:hypothetical protein BSKO_13503 [Bryopsis sp. KO-2023]
MKTANRRIVTQTCRRLVARSCLPTHKRSVQGMRGANPTPVVKDLVLLGGGHSHVEVLRSFGMSPVPGARLTVITKDVHTPYSGMLPGYVSGFYSAEEVHIDLSLLANFAGARLIHCEATGIDLQGCRVLLKDRPAISYDALAINIGITPNKGNVSVGVVTPVKPISSFVPRFERLLERVEKVDRPIKVVVVGGGAGGVELALSLQYRLENLRKELGRSENSKAEIKLVTKGSILSTHIPYVRRSFLRICEERGVEICEGKQVLGAEEGKLRMEGGEFLEFDECLWCTQASAAPWVKETGLKTDPQGFILIDEYLRCVDAPPGVFSAGDVATSITDPRPKAGVFAVRQGPPLAANLRRFLLEEPLQAFQPQSTFLSLISTGNRNCVGSKGIFGWQSEWLWTLKDTIDRKFMYKYGRDLPMDMQTQDAQKEGEENPSVSVAGGKAGASVMEQGRMRCAGCGGKVGWGLLSKALASVSNGASPIPEDCAIIKPPPAGHLTLQTVDFLTSFVTDPYVFSCIVTNHCLSDIYAMGGNPETALAVVMVPFAADEKMEADLTQIMSGVTTTLEKENCSLAGGHSCEGAELCLGLFVQGLVKDSAVLRKSGMEPTQDIILTKPLGTGTLLAAAMRGKAKGDWITKATEMMLVSNSEAARVFVENGATSCTDVTGFGLLGHLAEMVQASNVSAEIFVDGIPALDGAKTTLEANIVSSIDRHNQRVASLCAGIDSVESWIWALMVDPQTSGGLIASIPSSKTDQCLTALREAGYPSATTIGRVSSQKIREDKAICLVVGAPSV